MCMEDEIYILQPIISLLWYLEDFQIIHGLTILFIVWRADFCGTYYITFSVFVDIMYLN